MLELLRSLEMPEWLIKCASGDIAPPEFTFDRPCNLDYGFPPAVLPIWSNPGGPYYIGVLHHWLGSRRTTFVRYSSEAKHFVELARTPGQLRIWLVFDFLCNVPDTDEVAAFASETGLCAKDALEAFFSGYQEEDDLARHPSFQIDLPRHLVAGRDVEYSGDFPFGDVDLRRYCDFEVPREVLLHSTDAPLWFSNAAKPGLFDHLIASGDLQGAWFCLNSSGWKVSEMKNAIQRLASLANVYGLSVLANWIQRDVPDGSSY